MSTLISVVIPVYNDSLRLAKCLRALERQSIPKCDFEVIVVNNNPKDQLNLSQFEASINLIQLVQPKPGSYAARNLAISYANSQILAFTDSDCIPDKDWLMNGMNCLESSDNVGIVAGSIHLFYKDKKLTPTEVYEKYTAFNQEKSSKSGYNTTANWFSYKSVIMEAGMFQEDLKSNGDSILSNKIYKMGYAIKYCPTASILHPARFRLSEIISKRRRIIGGRSDFIKSKSGNLVIGLCKACISFLKSNMKKSGPILKQNMWEGIQFIIVVWLLFLSIVFESTLLLFGKKSVR